MKFWTNAILERSKLDGDLLLNKKTILCKFQRCGKYPKCLSTVIDELVRIGKLKSLYLFQNQSNSWSKWGFDTFLRRPLSSVLSKLYSPSNSFISDTTETFVILDQVKAKADELVCHHWRAMEQLGTGGLLDYSDFLIQTMQLLHNEADFDLVFHQLMFDQKVLLYQDEERKVVKVCRMSDKKVLPLQDRELNIHRLDSAVKKLEKEIASLSHDADRCTTEARKYVSENRKTMAMQQLRRRKSLQRLIDKRSGSVSTMQTMLQSIDESSSNEMVLNAYKAGICMLQSVTDSLTTDKLDTTMSNLQEIMEEHEELNRSMVNMDLSKLDIGNENLEDELESLLNDECMNRDCHGDVRELAGSFAKHSLNELPDVPSTARSHQLISRTVLTD